MKQLNFKISLLIMAMALSFASFTASASVESDLVAAIQADPGNAAALIQAAVNNNPGLAASIATAVANANIPGVTPDIIAGAAAKGAPGAAAQIVAALVFAAPSYATQIAAAANNASPSVNQAAVAEAVTIAQAVNSSESQVNHLALTVDVVATAVASQIVACGDNPTCIAAAVQAGKGLLVDAPGGTASALNTAIVSHVAALVPGSTILQDTQSAASGS